MIEGALATLKIPNNWAWLNIGEVIEKIPLTGKKLKQSEYKEIARFPVIDQGQSFIGGFTDKEDLRIIVKKPVIIFGDHTKIFKFVNFDFIPGADGVKVFRPDEIFDPKLFYYFLQSISLPEKGYARHFQWLEKAFIPLPPLHEQHRIVAKIEELFTKLEAGVEALKKVKAQLKRYRQAVLKYAFEGKLTQEWREANKDKLEPASALLERIKGERKKKAEGKFKEFPPVDTTDLPELPDGWVWARVGEIAEVVRGASPRPAGHPKYFGGNIPWITVGEITKDKNPYLHSVTNFVTEEGKDRSRYIEPGILLLTNSGATLGVPKITFIGGCINDGSVAFLDLNENMKLFLYYFFLSQTKKLRQVNQGAAQPNLNTSIVKNIIVPFASLNEQSQIASEVETRFSMADEMEKIAEQTLKQSERLRQSILKTAFEGKLVPQDPTDEPAGKLLERIKAEKAKKESETKGGRKKSTQMELK